MSRSAGEIRKLIRQGWEMPDGPGQIVAAEEAVRHADAVGDQRLAFAARMLATSAYHCGGEPAKSFVTFSWCLSAYDAEPGGFEAADDKLLRWHFKFVVSSLLSFPDIPLDRTRAVLDDMERRYRIGGHSLRAVYHLRWALAGHLGDTSASDEWYARWCAAPRDENSDCAGCDLTERLLHLASRGLDAEAVALAAPVLGGRLACPEQPHSMLTGLMVPYLRTARLTEAADAHRRAYRAYRDNSANLGAVASHVTFCGRTGNEVRGLEVLRRHLDWLDHAPTPYDSMEFAGAAALVLRRLADTGHGDLPVIRRAGSGRTGGETSVARLVDELTELATGLAARFDARNGTACQGARVAALLIAEPIVAQLPLVVTPRSDPRRTFGRARSDEPAEGGTGPPDPPTRVPPDATAVELLDLAEAYERRDRGAAARTVLRAFDQRYGADSALPVELRARRDDALGTALMDARDVAGAEAAWRRAMAGHWTAGDLLRAQVAAGRLGLLLCLTDRAAEGLALMETSHAAVLQHGPADRRAAAWARFGTMHVAAGRPVEAWEAYQRATVEAADADDPHLVAYLALQRALCLAELNRPDELAETARTALAAHRALGGDRLPLAWLCYGRAIEATDPAGALAAYDEAVRTSSPGTWSIEPRLARARALVTADRPADAVVDLVEAVALCTELELADGAAFIRVELAAAYRQAGRLLDAAEAAEEGVTALSALGAQEAADRCRYLLSGIYQELGEDDAALGLLDQLAVNLDGFDNLVGRARMHEEAGELLYRLDRDALAGARFAQAADTYARARHWLDGSRARRRGAVALRWAGDHQAALEALAAADAAIQRLPADAAETPAAAWERAMLGYDGGKILAGLDRLAEALARITPVPGQFRGIEAFGEASMAELLLGEVLLASDRPAEAEPVLRTVLAGLPRDAEPVPQAAWLLGEALDQLGRGTEARQIRIRYGLDAGEDI